MTDKKLRSRVYDKQVYTKTGDRKTSLVGGQKVLKSNIESMHLEKL